MVTVRRQSSSPRSSFTGSRRQSARSSGFLADSFDISSRNPLPVWSVGSVLDLPASPPPDRPVAGLPVSDGNSPPFVLPRSTPKNRIRPLPLAPAPNDKVNDDIPPPANGSSSAFHRQNTAAVFLNPQCHATTPSTSRLTPASDCPRPATPGQPIRIKPNQGKSR
jgi:hypothetical protein